MPRTCLTREMGAFHNNATTFMVAVCNVVNVIKAEKGGSHVSMVGSVPFFWVEAMGNRALGYLDDYCCTDSFSKFIETFLIDITLLCIKHKKPCF